MCVTLDRVWIDDQIYCTIVRPVTTSNYSVIVNLHTLQITRAQAKPSQSVFTSRHLVTDLNNVDTSDSVLTSILSGEYSTRERLLQTLPVIIYRDGPCRKYHFQNFVYRCTWIRCRGNLLVSQSPPSNGSTLYNILKFNEV
jgi:hypothetical protein